MSIKGENYENDVLFWQEIQKYKVKSFLVFVHNHAHAKVVSVKMCITRAAHSASNNGSARLASMLMASTENSTHRTH